MSDEIPHAQAIILAAGRGSRLKDSNSHQPKCLAEVNGVRLIDHQLRALERIGVGDVCVVTGYKAEAVCAALPAGVHMIHNPNWETTNSLYSLSMCRDWISGPVLVLNCDVLAHHEVFERLVRQMRSAITYDSASGDDDEHMKVELAGGLVTGMSKQLARQKTFGENVGILFFSLAAARELMDQAGAIVRDGGSRLWVAAAVERVARRLPIRAVDIRGLPWIEIDFPSDLAQARQQFWPTSETVTA